MAVTSQWIRYDSLISSLLCYCPAALVVPGWKEVQSAYQSELAGIYGGTLFMVLVGRAFQIAEGAEGEVEFRCDRLSSLKAISRNNISTKDDHFDLIRATQAIMEQSKLTWHAWHVAGHQDDNPETMLDLWAQLNIQIDREAKEHWEVTKNDVAPMDYEIMGAPWAVKINQFPLCRDWKDTIRAHCQSQPAALAYLRRKGKLQPET